MTTLITGNTVAELIISDTDKRIIAPTATINVGFEDAIDFNFGSDPGQLVVSGLVVSSLTGIRPDGNDHIVITQTGAVIGSGNGADGIAATGTGNTFRISGDLIADDIAFYSDSGSDVVITITETGVVQGGSNTFGRGLLPYSAAIFAAIDGQLANDGAIVADYNPDLDRRIAFMNTFVASEEVIDADTDRDFLFFNTGNVIGDILLSGGEDLYDGRATGQVDGIIDLGSGNDTAYGGDSFDNIVGGANKDLIHGGGGSDSLSGGAGLDTMTGGQGDDTMLGGGSDDIIRGNAGDDELRGGDGNDAISGGAGDDYVSGGADDDVLFGKAGDDWIDSGSGNDTVRGGQGDDLVEGFDGDDSLLGNAGDDSIKGGANNDTLSGGLGDDTLIGTSGNDSLLGGADDDSLAGGADDDVLNGGAGTDTMSGGAGFDTYVFERNFGQDLVKNFEDNNNEKIDLSAVAAITDFADLVADHLSQVGSDALIDAGNGNIITILNFNAADLDAGDFIF